ncbi:MAG: TRAM domain-containing protein, partial [Chloroflexi bacterium]|nr:TRAM domain-containing protein [Chloroflexota bacterium]
NHKGKWTGRTRNNKIVFFEDEANWHGQLAKVKITETTAWSLRGTVTGLTQDTSASLRGAFFATKQSQGMTEIAS